MDNSGSFAFVARIANGPHYVNKDGPKMEETGLKLAIIREIG